MKKPEKIMSCQEMAEVLLLDGAGALVAPELEVRLVE
jgi:hypothetical protein